MGFMKWLKQGAVLKGTIKRKREPIKSTPFSIILLGKLNFPGYEMSH